MGRAQMILLLCSPTKAQMMFSTHAVISMAMGVCVLLALQLGGAAAANVRLVNGDRCSGRVEMRYQWASVCDAGWDMRDAEVVCRELGCGDPVKAVTNPEYVYGQEPLFGRGSLLWLVRIECTGTENSLIGCPRENFQECGFNRQAGVICSGVTSSGASPLPSSVYQRCPLKVTVPPGGAVTLSCLSGCQGTCVTGQRTADCQLESGRAQLHIDAVAPEHAGDYNCSSDQTRLFTVDIHSDGCVSALQHEVVFVGDALQTLTTSSAIQCQLACTLQATCQLFSFQEEQQSTPSICTLRTRDSTQHFSVDASVGTTSGFSLRNCPGTVMSPIRSYTLLQEPVSWEEAQRRCNQSHTGLAVILSKQHLQYAQQALGGSTLSTWLGLHREAADQQWVWTGMFQQWEQGHDGKAGCVLSHSGEWYTQSCDSSGFPMCQYECSVSGESVKVFSIVRKTMSWEAAEKFCRDAGGDLASILSQQEHTAFQEAALAAGVHERYYIWIGLSRSDAALPWMWTNGKLPMGSAAADGQNCGVFNGTHWSPEDCSHKHTQFLCYQDGADATTTATTTTTTTTPAPETTSTTPAPVTTTTPAPTSTTTTTTPAPESTTTTSPAPVSTTTTTPAPESTSTTPAPESTTTTTTTTTTPAHESTTTTTSAPVSTTTNTPAPVSTATPMICNKSRCILGELVYVNISVSWLEALNWCEQRGLRLLHILSNATQTQLNLLLSSLKPPYGPADIAWVGLIHCFLQPKETWEWLDGPLEHYEHWHPDSPRWRFGYHCGQVTKVEPGNYMWLDDCCSRKRPFVCQKVTDGRSKGTNPARGGRAPCYQRYT